MELNKKAWFAISIAILGIIFCLIFPPFDYVITNVDLIVRLAVLGIMALLIIGSHKKYQKENIKKLKKNN